MTSSFDGFSEPTRKALQKLAAAASPKINVPTPQIRVQSKAHDDVAKTMDALKASLAPPAGLTSLAAQLDGFAKNSPTARALETLAAGMSAKLRGFDMVNDELRKKLAAAAKPAQLVDVRAAFDSTVQSLGEQRSQALREVERHTDALRAAVIAASEAGWSEVELAETASVDRMTIRRWLAKR